MSALEQLPLFFEALAFLAGVGVLIGARTMRAFLERRGGPRRIIRALTWLGGPEDRR